MITELTQEDLDERQVELEAEVGVVPSAAYCNTADQL